MASPGTELASLDFASIVGSPLVAVIQAQSIAARSTVDFIKTVGFDADDKPVYVDFKYPKEISPYQPAVVGVTGAPAIGNPSYPTGMIGSGFSVGVANDGSNLVGYPPFVPAVTAVTPVMAIPAVYQEMKMSMPLLNIVTIPFIKIDKFTMDFNAKINSMETTSQSTDASISGSLEVQQRWGSGSAKLNVNAAYKKSTASSSNIERTYSMAIHVEASQDEMPAGMEKLLNILEGAMISKPGAIGPL
jgi:hypothetical protein